LDTGEGAHRVGRGLKKGPAAQLRTARPTVDPALGAEKGTPIDRHLPAGSHGSPLPESTRLPGQSKRPAPLQPPSSHGNAFPSAGGPESRHPCSRLLRARRRGSRCSAWRSPAPISALLSPSSRRFASQSPPVAFGVSFRYSPSTSRGRRPRSGRSDVSWLTPLVATLWLVRAAFPRAFEASEDRGGLVLAAHELVGSRWPAKESEKPVAESSEHRAIP
jgi:hypothetical protein